MAEKNIRVFSVDDHTLVHEAIRSLTATRNDMILVGSETTGGRALRLINELKPDVVVIEISLADINGLMLTQRVIAENPQINVVVLSMYEERAYVRRALEVGAKAYVSKRSRADHLLQAISAAADGGVYIDPAVAPRLLGSDANHNVLAADSLCVHLTDREADVVRLIALGNTAKEIAGQLGVTVKSVETYKSRACEKLNMKTRTQLVRYAATQGWLMQV